METKTIAQQLGITKFPFEIHDENGRRIYLETSKSWSKTSYLKNGKIKSYEDSSGYYFTKEVDANDNVISYKDSNGVTKTY